ncbi:MAG: hypothetical protein Q8922_02425 [Bacteroidota bacterium]|nr:hypothetical protein [Bacteroidota bacterium]MDP4286768.1 hypothetical protein [Bacteroidota bacterium]
MITISGRAVSQAVSNSTGTQLWPINPPVGIGTQLSPPGVLPIESLQLHYDPAAGTPTLPAILRFSNGASTASDTFGIIGLMPPPSLTTYSSLSKGQDMVLQEHSKGDVIITNFWAAGASAGQTGGSIRLATAGDTTIHVTPKPPEHDIERMIIRPNGNVGINIPKDSIPVDQLQLGGGIMPYPGNTYPNPGLTIYGGNRYENMPIDGGGGALFPGDWRYVAYNRWVDHTNPGSNRFHRSEPMSSSAVSFSENAGGNIDLSCFPYDVTRGIDDFTHSLTMEVTGNGLQMWS